MSTLNIHGREVNYYSNKNYGLYVRLGIGHEYAEMDVGQFVDALNKMPKNEVASNLKAFRDMVLYQETNGKPECLEFPLVRQTGPSTPYSAVKQNIVNLREFADSVLEALNN